jgi:hypothetical protein
MLHSDIERGMMQRDASFAVGLLLAFKDADGKNGIPFILSSIDFHALIIHEASEYYTRHNMPEASRLRSDFSEVIKQSRQRIKLFDDNVLGVDGIGELFINTLTPQHQTELSKDHRIRLPKWLWDDIGVYLDTDTQIPVCTTHLASFNSGITNPKQFFSADTWKSLGENLGMFLIIAGKAITLVRFKDVSITSKDMRYNQIYSKKHYGSDNEQVNAGLSVIDMRMNFLALLALKCSQSPTMFKWKFLSIYHAISSLNKFAQTEHFNTLNDKSKQSIKSTLNSPIAALMLSPEAVPLRNTLTHYGLDTRLDNSKLHDNAQTLYGLVEASFTEWTYGTLDSFLDEQLKGTLLDIFNTWKK